MFKIKIDLFSSKKIKGMGHERVFSILIGVAIIGVLTGLTLENIIEGDEAKLRSFLQGLKTNFVGFPLHYAELSAVENMITHAQIDFEIIMTAVDPDPNVAGDEHFLNQISECVFTSDESLDFETCLICVISSEPPDNISCDCTRPTKFTVQYFGPEPVTIEVYKSHNDFGKPEKLLASFNPVMNEQEITIDSTMYLNGPRGDVHSNTVYRITDGVSFDDDVKIHTSCSKPLFVGDIHEGDSVQLIVVSGTTVNDIQSVPDAVCRELTCECTKPTVFTVRYNASVEEIALGPVDIKVYRSVNDIGNSGKLLASFSPVFDGDPITIDSRLFTDKPKDKVHSSTVYSITRGGAPVAVFNIHTSCSQPLFVDQVFADGETSLTVVAGLDKQGQPSLPSSTCEMTIEQELGFGGGIVLEGWKMLPDGYIAGTQESIFLPIGADHPENDVSNAHRVTLAVCADIPPDCECEKPTVFTVQYNSHPDGDVSGPVDIEVYHKKGDIGNPNKVLASFSGVVNGDPITIDSRLFTNDPKNKVYPNTIYSITQNGSPVEVIAIHTSCSQPLFIGDIHEGPNNSNDVSLTVLSGTDINGNPSIPEPICKIEEDIKCEGVTSMTVFYSGPDRWIEVSDDKIVDVINTNTGITPSLEINANPGKELPSNTVFKIYNIKSDQSRGSFIEEVKIHTSCSKPISEGDLHSTKDGALTITSLVKIFDDDDD